MNWTTDSIWNEIRDWQTTDRHLVKGTIRRGKAGRAIGGSDQSLAIAMLVELRKVERNNA